MKKPRLFIGSSVESLPIARATGHNLEYDAEVTLWDSGIFKLSSNALDDLTTTAKHVDFAVFIFTPEDITNIRSAEHHTVRDNVIFELGLFIGSIGKERCFTVSPRGVELHLPSDLAGLTNATYQANRNDGNLTSALSYACNQIRTELESKGPLTTLNQPLPQKVDLNNVSSDLSSSDFSLLRLLLESYNESPTGSSYYTLTSKLNELTILPTEANLTLIKLERMGLIERYIEDDYHGNTYNCFNLTGFGVDICLKHQTRMASPF
ncbi:TIR domain-containing protein [Halodesulfovibrio spirochaetisodalis]|uniref:CD-NTase-associated protein 12/Pycsar effector protein TIR domain-containing protein n=1 Tax=Halodesulfovibrio spirochaetisodalis TaxID=1560234 RepID=A0A1B7XAS4_9BACT|nr:nucleotide-binding protein [Halodesulfovibrio spirochaetisodalis]OBQ46464.1 hypothetical protein SP90_12215 [Halodesulfovibrio spirochaetisodalis]